MFNAGSAYIWGFGKVSGPSLCERQGSPGIAIWVHSMFSWILHILLSPGLSWRTKEWNHSESFLFLEALLRLFVLEWPPGSLLIRGSTFLVVYPSLYPVFLKAGARLMPTQRLGEKFLCLVWIFGSKESVWRHLSPRKASSVPCFCELCARFPKRGRKRRKGEGTSKSNPICLCSSETYPLS